MRRATWWLLLCASATLFWGSWRGRLPIGMTEVAGFATGAACVLLVIEESLWNFPVGIANNFFFIALFFSARLYGDMGLQVVYLALGIAGWWQWARGGADDAPLAVTAAGRRERGALLAVGIAATALGSVHLNRIGDASPVLDALTTVLSLVAQWLLNKKRIDNWWVWIAADVLYVWLYVQRGLHLTALLYAVFIVMCVAGLRRWHVSLHGEAAAQASITDAA